MISVDWKDVAFGMFVQEAGLDIHIKFGDVTPFQTYLNGSLCYAQTN